MAQSAGSNIDYYHSVFPENDANAVSAYRNMINPMFDFEIPETANATPFSAEVESFCLPDVTVSKVRTTASRLTRSVRTIAKAATDEIIVVCYTDGHFTYQIGDVQRRVEAGEVAIFDLSQELIIEAPFVANISLAISRRRLEATFPLLDSTHGFVVPAGALSKVLIGTVEQVIEAGPSTKSSEAGPIADSIILLTGGCLELMSPQKPVSGAAAGAVTLARMKAVIEQRLTDAGFGPKSLLDEFGITRSTLYRTFEPLGGVSAYITERRLRYAFRQITDPSQKELRLSQLAFDLGFTHASAFTRSFKARFGMTPKEIRSLAIRPKGNDVPFEVAAAALPYMQPPEE